MHQRWRVPIETFTEQELVALLDLVWRSLLARGRRGAADLIAQAVARLREEDVDRE
jgi:hypothetical protein